MLDQIHPHGVGDDGLRRWTVLLPQASYDGKALTPADWTRQHVLDALNDFAARTSFTVACARLYSPVKLHEVR